METLEQYFERANTPAAGSPVAFVMTKVLEKYPELDFEGAQAKAHELLAHAARGKNYRMPRVRSAAELVEDARRLKVAFGRAKEAA